MTAEIYCPFKVPIRLQTDRETSGLFFTEMAGNITIYEPEENYQKVSKSIIFDGTIDALTLGIYVKILCLGKEWNLNISGLSTLLELSSAKVKTAISKLEKAGYVKRQRVRNESNQFIGWDYIVSSIPFDPAERSDLSKSRLSEKPTIGKTDYRENLPPEKPTIGESNGIYRDNNEDRNLNVDKDNNISKSRKVFVKPTIEEVAAYCRERGNTIDPEAFIDHYESNGWIVGRSPMKDWKAAVRTWEKRRDIRPASSKPEKESLTDYYRKLYKQLGINPDGTAIGAPAQQTPPQYGRQPYDFAADFGIDEQ